MLIIQKHILLLNDFYFTEFCNYLEESKAALSLRLVKIINESGWEQPESDELCLKVYGSADEKAKRKFLQLTHHTFKLSSFLSRNYPSYLKQNLVLIEQHINAGDKTKANILAELLADIAEKTEDFGTHIEVLKFFAQQSFITDSKDSVKFHLRIRELIELQQQQNEIYYYLREHLHYKKKENLSLVQLGKCLEFFQSYAKNTHLSISILARFGKYYELSFLNHSDFYQKSSLDELDSIERDLQNNAFLIFPFLDDLLFKVLGLKLQWMVNSMESEGMMKASMRIIEESGSLKFWKSYINLPELFALAVQSSHYLTYYGETFRENFYSTLPSEIKTRVAYLKQKIKMELEKPIWDEGYIIKLINTRGFYSALLLLGTQEEIEEAINLIEETFITYQQIPFQKLLDAMFASLIIGYFSLKNYSKVVESYKRYRKSTAGNIVNEENDLTICAYYYTAQLLLTGRRQYHEKLMSTYAATNSRSNLQQVKRLIESLGGYFKITFPQ